MLYTLAKHNRVEYLNPVPDDPRQQRKPKTFRQLAANTASPLYAYLRHGRELARLDRLLDGVLAESERQHCRVANLHGDTLILHADSSAWAARLRFAAPAMLARLREHRQLAALRQVRIRVASQTSASATDAAIRSGRPGRELSDSARALIDQLAESLRDEDIRAAFKRLASRKPTG